MHTIVSLPAEQKHLPDDATQNARYKGYQILSNEQNGEVSNTMDDPHRINGVKNILRES